MAMTSAEIQYALDRRGFVNIPSGTDMYETVNLAHLQGNIFIKNPGGDITWRGPPGRFAFEWNWDDSYEHSPCSLTFRDIEFDRNRIDGGFLKVVGTEAPERLTMKRCRLSSERGYCIDANGVGSSESLYFEDTKTFESSSIRWITNSQDGVNWVVIDNWRTFATERLGASFQFKNLRNLLCDRLIEDGTPEITDVLKNNYVGPLCVNFVNCSGYSRIDGYWFEPWGDWSTLAPDCYAFSIRADETSGNHKLHHLMVRDVSFNAGGVDPSVVMFHLNGGDTSNDAAVLRMDFEDMWRLYDGDTIFGGKVMAVAKRPVDTSEYSADDLAAFNDYHSGSFRDRWQIATSVHPYQVYADRISYSSSGYADTWVVSPVQPESA